MFKKFSASFLKRIILLTLFSFSVLLMVINISISFGREDKPSFSNIKQSTVAKPSFTKFPGLPVQTPQAVWNFLQTREKFGIYDLKTEDWNSWLDIIQKRKIQKTFNNRFVNTVVDLRSLWDVDNTLIYANLTPKVKETLTKLSQIVYISNYYRRYEGVLRITVDAFSFKKEKHGAVYDLITILKKNNRWTNLKKYQIKKINDVNIESLLSIENIESLSGNAETYNGFSDAVKISLRNLLDLDVEFSPFFSIKSYQSLVDTFENKNGYNPILNALGTRIDNVIKKTIDDSKDWWNFLKQNDRLTKLKTYQINMIDDVNLTSLLQNPTSQIDYDALTPAQKITLSLLTQIARDIKLDIANKITTAAQTANRIWTFLKDNNRLQDIKTRLIPYIDDVDVSSLHGVESTTSYDDLSNAAKGTLFDLSQIPNYDATTIDTFIQYDKDIEVVWTFLQSQEHFNLERLNTEDWDSWLDIIQKRKVRQTASAAQTTAVRLTSLWNVEPTANYADLTPEIKKTLAELSQLAYSDPAYAHWDYHWFIRNTIELSFKKETRDVVVDLIKMLKKNNRWNNLKKYEIEKIADIDIKPLLRVANFRTLSANKDTYNAFSELVKVSLRNLLDLNLNASDYFKQKKPLLVYENKTNVNQILNALATRIDGMITQATAASAAWTFLKTNSRLANLKKYQIKTIDTVALLPTFQTVALSKTYGKLTDAQKTLLYNLSQVTTYQTKINDLIQKDTDAETAWTFLRNENRLANLKQYQINIINGIALSSLFPNIALTKEYPDLSLVQKTTLYTLSQLENYQVEIQKILGPRNAWKFLQTNNYLKQLQTKKTLKTNIFDLNILAKIKPNAAYATLTNEQTNALYHLSKLGNYQYEITTALIKSSEFETEDRDNLLWLWIALPFFVLIISKLGFYFFHTKIKPKLKNKEK